jgi:hypothetical protein
VLARRRRDNQIKPEKIGREDQCAARHLCKQCRSTSSAAQFPLWVDIVAKVEKSNDPENLAKVDFWTLLLPQGSLGPIRRPVVVFV